MEKVLVNGEHSHDIFKYLRYNSLLFDYTENECRNVHYNFGKWIIPLGKHVDEFEPLEYFQPHVSPFEIFREHIAPHLNKTMTPEQANYYLDLNTTLECD